MRIIQLPSANMDSRENLAVDMLVLHYTGMLTAQAALDRLTDPRSKVSAHYVVGEEGDIWQLVPENMRAWHAGVSYWRGHTNINQRSVGIEIVNPGHEFGYRIFPPLQMQSVIALCQGIMARHTIPARNVVGHSDIAPERKEDPGELFNWRQLAEAGCGLWPRAPWVSEGVMADMADAVELLSRYGYDTANLPKAIAAFQRHFFPSKLGCAWDAECAQLLEDLLTQAKA